MASSLPLVIQMPTIYPDQTRNISGRTVTIEAYLTNWSGRFVELADNTKPLILLVASEETSPSVLYGLYDVLYSVGAVYPDMTVGEPLSLHWECGRRAACVHRTNRQSRCRNRLRHVHAD